MQLYTHNKRTVHPATFTSAYRVSHSLDILLGGGGGRENFLHGNYSKLDVIIIYPIVANIWGGL